MAELPRLNGIIKALEEGGVAFVGAAPAVGRPAHQRSLRRRAVRDGARSL